MRTICFFLLVLILVSSYARADEKRVFHWVDDTDYKPLIYRGADGKPCGVFFDIMTEAFRRLDISLRVETYPWVRAQKIVTEGKADGMITILTNARKPLFCGSEPILRAREHVFFNKSNPRANKIKTIRSLEEIRSFKVVEIIGSGWTKEKLRGFNVIWVPNMDSAFGMVVKGRADIFISNIFTGLAFVHGKIKAGGAEAKSYGNIAYDPIPLKTLAFRLLVRKDSPFADMLGEFNKILTQMRKDGTVKRILEKARLPYPDDAHGQK